MLQAISRSTAIRSALLRPALRTTGFQPLWNTLHRLSLWGMNIGPAGHVEGSGERWALSQAMQRKGAGSPFVLFDVGANAGQYATEALSLQCADLQIYCFEPSAPMFQALSNKLGGRQNARLFNFGLSREESEATLYFHLGGEGEASLQQRDLSHWGIAQDKQVTVRLRRLDDFCREAGVKRIDFLKIDVEGHEVAVLEGAGPMLSNGSIQTIQFEFGSPDIESRTFFKDLFRLLNPYYELYRVVHHGLQPVLEYSEFLETFITVNYLAVARGGER